MTRRLKVNGPSDAASTVRATRLCDDIVIEQRPWGLRLRSGPAFIDFSPVQWVEVVAAVEVVDVPTPGQRLALALMTEGLIVDGGCSIGAACDRIAARLGITEGGE
jgi:hypothetical protein